MTLSELTGLTSSLQMNRPGKTLPWVEYAHNSLPTSATGLSPFHCCLGHQPPLFPSQEEVCSTTPDSTLLVCHGFKSTPGLTFSARLSRHFSWALLESYFWILSSTKPILDPCLFLDSDYCLVFWKLLPICQSVANLFLCYHVSQAKSLLYRCLYFCLPVYQPLCLFLTTGFCLNLTCTSAVTFGFLTFLLPTGCLAWLLHTH